MFRPLTAYSLTSHKECFVNVMPYVNQRLAVPVVILPVLVTTNGPVRNDIKALVIFT